MKKHWMILGTCVLAASLLAGCGSSAAPSSSAATLPIPPDLSAEIAAPQIQETITYTVERVEWQKNVTAEDGTLLLSGHNAVPVLHAYLDDGSEVTEDGDEAQVRALATVRAFNAKFAQWSEDAEDFQNLIEMAQEDYAFRAGNNQEWPESYTSQFNFTSWQTDHMVSISGLYETYTGGAHPGTVEMAWIFDLDSGVFIDPASLADNSQQFQDAVTQEIIRQANVKAEQEGQDPAAMYWENYQEIAGQWPSYAVSFDNEGDMTIIFSQYEMACYAAGAQEFLISADFLKPYLGNYGRAMLGFDAEK